MTDTNINPSQDRFDDDRRREEVLAAYLDNQLYPEIAKSSERQDNIEKQKLGNDIEVTFDWLDRPVIVDEKAQSGKYLNDPVPTFVMEIFGESSISNGNIETSTGWFIAEDNITEYYVLVWLPSASTFELKYGIDEDPILVYNPAEPLLSDKPGLDSKLDEFMLDKGSDEYRMEFTRANIDQFQTVAEPIPEILFDTDKRDLERVYYDPANIHEVKVAVVKKEKVVQAFADVGLDKETLAELGREAIRGSGDTVPVPTSKAKYIMRSHRQIPGSNREENPVNLIVKYETYDDLTNRTYHIRNGSLEKNCELF